MHEPAVLSAGRLLTRISPVCPIVSSCHLSQIADPEIAVPQPISDQQSIIVMLVIAVDPVRTEEEEGKALPGAETGTQ